MTASYVYGQDEALIGWAEAQIPNCRFRSDARAIGLVRDGNLAGAFVYDHFSPSGCFMHVASDRSRRWLTRGFLFRAFAYPFLQCGFARVTAPVSELNAESRRIVEKLGGVEEGRLREAGLTGEDVIVFGMLARECRWLPRTGIGTPSAL